MMRRCSSESNNGETIITMAQVMQSLLLVLFLREELRTPQEMGQQDPDRRTTIKGVGAGA